MQNWAAPDMILPEMPHDLAAECSVLGAILINPEVYEYVEALVPNAFYRAEHQLIFNRMLSWPRKGSRSTW